MTKEEFVEMLTIMSSRLKDKRGVAVVAYRRAEDVPTKPLADDKYEADMDNWGSLCVSAFGLLCVDDHDDKPARESNHGQQCTSTPLYRLDEIHTDKWPDGLFKKLSSYTWWIDPKDEINLLDVIATKVGISK